MDYNKHKRKNRQFYPKTNRGTSYAVVGETVKNQPKLSSKTQFVCKYVTLANKTLSGSQTVDSNSPANGDKILVANQTDKKENGIYTYDDTDDWIIDPTISPGAIITITGGTKQGTVWVIETALFLVGTDDIEIVESALNRKGSDFDSFSALTAADEDLLLAEDYSDSYNKKRVSLSALKTFFNFLSKAANNFTTFTSVTPDEDDVLLIEDDSDSYNKKKITIGDILGLVPESVLAAQYTLFVSPTFPNSNQMFSTFAAAVAFANTAPNDAHVWTIRTYSATHTGNYDVNNNIVECIGDVEFKPSSNSSPLMSFEGGRLTGNPILTNGAQTMTVPLVTVKTSAKLQAKRIVSNIRALEVQSNAGDPTVDLELDVHDLGDVKDANTGGTVLMKIDANSCSGFVFNGNTNSNYLIDCKEMSGTLEINNGYCRIEAKRYLNTSIRLFEVTGGSLIATGRLEEYAATTDAATGDGFPYYIADGSMRLIDIQAKNANGGVIFGMGGELIMSHTVLESGTTSGGNKPTIDSLGPFSVLYTTKCSLNEAVAPTVTETATGNRETNPSIRV